MIELGLMVFVALQVRKLSERTGLPMGWMVIALAIPVAGFIIATPVGVVLGIMGVQEPYVTFGMVPFAIAAECLAAWGILSFVKRRAVAMPAMSPTTAPNPAYPAVPDTAQFAAVPASNESKTPRMAGFCTECDANVWLTPQGACGAGHDASCIQNPYQV